MSREILFRGKRVDNGEWTEGYLFKQWNRTFLLWGMTGDIPNMTEVIPETVGQFTGLTDKNGKKIFEGDIVRDWDGRIYEIKYSDFEWIAEQTKSFWINIKHLKPCEVIGNIYDNPELLEVEK